MPLTHSCEKEMRRCTPKGFSRSTFIGFRIKPYFFIHCTFCSQLGGIDNLSFSNDPKCVTSHLWVVHKFPGKELKPSTFS